MTEKNKKAKLVIISGPSGVGKSTICTQVIEQMDNVSLSVSATTREKGSTEVDGREYRFMGRQEFQDRIDKHLFLEYAEVFGNLYGTPLDAVERQIQAGKTVLLEIDVQGARKVSKIYPQAVKIFIVPPAQKDLAERMRQRGREDGREAEKRLSSAGTEIAMAWQYYDQMVINDDIKQAVNEVIRIIRDSLEL